jgi:hypothetical protein
VLKSIIKHTLSNAEGKASQMQEQLSHKRFRFQDSVPSDLIAGIQNNSPAGKTMIEASKVEPGGELYPSRASKQIVAVVTFALDSKACHIDHAACKTMIEASKKIGLGAAC